MTDFGNFLKQKRQEKSLTQKQLAGILFVSESAVSKWEKGVAHPDITLLPKLAETLGVTEHELITASVDNTTRQEKAQAKKWRVLSFSWSLFFYIAYAIALVPCFICNLAINKTLSWFWIVVSALLLAFTVTNLPKYIKKYKLILLPLSFYLSLCLLLAVCCIYTQGKWFLIPMLAILLGLVIIFMPIYIAKYKIFSRVKKFGDFISVFIDFAVLNILLIVIDIYSVNNGFAMEHWYLKLALPITFVIYLIISLLMSVRFIKVNKLIKSSIILGIIEIITYVIVPLFISADNPKVQHELDGFNIYKANLSSWTEVYLEQNINCIVALTILFVAVCLLLGGICIARRKKNKESN